MNLEAQARLKRLMAENDIDCQPHPVDKSQATIEPKAIVDLEELGQHDGRQAESGRRSTPRCSRSVTTGTERRSAGSDASRRS
jgi:hypothetical protein